jgi:hypothetical protein
MYFCQGKTNDLPGFKNKQFLQSTLHANSFAWATHSNECNTFTGTFLGISQTKNAAITDCRVQASKACCNKKRMLQHGNKLP